MVLFESRRSRVRVAGEDLGTANKSFKEKGMLTALAAPFGSSRACMKLGACFVSWPASPSLESWVSSHVNVCSKSVRHGARVSPTLGPLAPPTDMAVSSEG